MQISKLNGEPFEQNELKEPLNKNLSLPVGYSAEDNFILESNEPRGPLLEVAIEIP